MGDYRNSRLEGSSAVTGHSSYENFKLGTPKGTRDYTPEQTALRQGVLDKIVAVFKKHGAESIDTPVFELKQLLTGQHGVNTDLVYDLKDQENETLSLRYDLTVPLARYIAMSKTSTMKRYHVAKVYRREGETALSNGRFREFYQCDFDIAGRYDPMIPDAECIKIISEILNALKIGDYVIRLNHRLLLDGIFEVCGVPPANREICSALDNLDKAPWSQVQYELIYEKGLSPCAAERMGKYVQLYGGLELADELIKNPELTASQMAVEGLHGMQLLLKYCNLLGLKDKILFDMSLVRGHEYYTGVIYECVLKDERLGALPIGSLAGGGRYDKLVGLLDPSGKQVPCVGVSIGVERLFTVIEAQYAAGRDKVRTTEVEIFLATIQDGLHEQRMELMRELWDKGIKVEHSYKMNPSLEEQMEYCRRNDIPLMALIGNSELQRGIAKLVVLKTQQETEIPLIMLADEIKKRHKLFN